MNIRHFLLLGVAAGFIAGCGESAPPVATSTPAAATTASPAAVPAPFAAVAVQEPRTLAGRNLDPEKIKRGETVYRASCASCHGPDGAGTPNWREPGADGRFPPPPLDGSAHAWHHSTETLESMIRKGSPGGGSGSMPAWEGKLTNQQIDDVIVWIKSLWPDEIYDIWAREIEHKQPP